MAMKQILLAASVLALGAPLWSDPPPPAPAADPEEAAEASAVVVPVAVDTKFLEEKTLPMQPALAQKGLAKMHLEQGKPPLAATSGKHTMNKDKNQSGDNRDQPNAMRLYGFTLAPGERLDLRLKSENSSKMWMRFGRPPAKDMMTGEVLAANRAPKPIRASHIGLKNITEAPYKIIAMVYGEAGYAYKLDIERSR